MVARVITFDTPWAYLRDVAYWWLFGLLIGIGIGMWLKPKVDRWRQ